jgi:hypothetical protein
MNKEQYLRYKMPSFESFNLESDNVQDPNLWFAKLFPESAKLHGPGFLQGTYEDSNGLRRFIPIAINEDSWAHAIGGDRRLCHEVVWYSPEETWYFYDPKYDAFVPTTTEKMEALLSFYLLKCSQEMGSLVEIRPLVTTFRKSETLARVLSRAKALLLASGGYFEGKNGYRRMVNGQIIEPEQQPNYEIFVKQGIIKDPTTNLSVADAFHKYFVFCKQIGQQPLTRQEFKHLVAEVIRENFKVGLRHDIRGPDGKQGHGWLGLNCRLALPEAVSAS